MIRKLAANAKMPRGGRRPGAGRKPSLCPRVLVNFTLDPALVAQLQSIIPPGKRSMFIEHLVRCALGSRGAGS
jgi:hypothetical protein